MTPAVKGRIGKVLERQAGRTGPQRVFRVIADQAEADAAVEALKREHTITDADLILVTEIIDPRPQ